MLVNVFRSAWLPVVAALLGLALLAPRAAHAQSQSIELGRIVTGVLSSDDDRGPYHDNHADRYTFVAYAGQRLEILMTSEVIDTYLVLQNPANIRLVEDDDSAGDLDSRILVTAPIDGMYTILATSYRLQEGPYELLVREFRPTAVSWVPLELGRTIHGGLVDTDATRTDNRRIDGYEFGGRAGDRIRIAASSTAFDTTIYLLGPTGEVLAENDDTPLGGTDSELAVELPSTGSYRVIVTGNYDALGDYTLEVDRVRFTPVSDTPVELGDAVNGSLGAGDGTWSSRGAYADGYTFEADSGQHVEITMSSGNLDSYLVLLGPDGSVLAENDDAGGELDSLISMRLANAGTYRALASSYNLSEGDYLLRLRALELRPLERRRIRVGQTLDAELTEDDPLRHLDPAHMDLFELDLDLGQRVVITMRSNAFNSFLWVVAPSGEMLREDDDSGGGLDALVELDAPYEGTYLVVATTYAGLTGDYSLSVRDVDEVDDSTYVDVELGGEVVGRLQQGDATTPRTGSYRDNYRFDGEAGSHVELRLESLQVDPMMALLSPSGVILAEDDDSGGGLNSLIQTILPESGVYTVIVTSYRPAIGDYALSLERFEPAPVTIAQLDIGSLASGELRAEDQRSPRYGTLVDAYDVSGEQGQRLLFEMTSAVLDPYLIVVDPNGEVIGEDDDGAGGLNSRLTLTLPITGTYRVLATSATFAEGAYQLGIEEDPPLHAPDPFESP